MGRFNDRNIRGRVQTWLNIIQTWESYINQSDYNMSHDKSEHAQAGNGYDKTSIIHAWWL